MTFLFVIRSVELDGGSSLDYESLSYHRIFKKIKMTIGF